VIWDRLLTYCLAKRGAWRDEPWEGDVVAKVGSKIFAFLGPPGAAEADGTGSAAGGGAVGVKCGPNREVADEWLARFPDDASASAYIGRSGWNTLRLDGGIDAEELFEAVDASYDMVVAKLPKRERPTA